MTKAVGIGKRGAAPHEGNGKVIRELLGYVADTTENPVWTEEEWRQAIGEAREHELEPALWARVSKGESDSQLPSGLARELQEAYCLNGLRNRKMYGELAVVLRALRARGVEALVLKGAYLAQEVYEDVACRVLSDIDILVPRRHLEIVRGTLIEGGYCPLWEESLETTFQRAHHLPSFLRPNSTPIEVHWTVVRPPSTVSIDPVGLWERSHAVLIAGEPARALSDTDLLLHLCLHAAHNHRWIGRSSEMPLRVLVDIAAVIRRNEHFDWLGFAVNANAIGGGRFVYNALAVTKRLVGAPVPELALANLDHTGTDDAIVSETCSFLVGRSTVELPDGMRRLLRSESLVDACRVVHGVVWPSASRLEARYGVVRNPRWTHLRNLASRLASPVRGGWGTMVSARGRMAAMQLVRRSRIARWKQRTI